MSKTPQDVIAAGIGNWLAGLGDEYSYHEPDANWRTLLDQQEGDTHDVAEYVLQGLAGNGYAVVKLPRGVPSNDPAILREWLGGEVMVWRNGHMEFDWHSIKTESAKLIAAALLAAVNAAES